MARHKIDHVLGGAGALRIERIARGVRAADGGIYTALRAVGTLLLFVCRALGSVGLAAQVLRRLFSLARFSLGRMRHTRAARCAVSDGNCHGLFLS